MAKDDQNQSSERHMFLDPMNDTPDKLIFALIGWLVWTDRPDTYREGLLELRNLIEYRMEDIDTDCRSTEDIVL